ncbi:MAG TPA: aspartate aminotransferase family protein [Clostridiales bacterium]|nr:aspartate aminotransferase family protein [Clostridiales bacterium]HBL81776.1 aspartate aminotransferase family protein [Clostridiales bacterium]
MTTSDIANLDKQNYMNTFGERIPVSFSKGEGIHLYSDSGEVYTDFLAGIAVNAVGHSHPALVKAICEQAQNLLHVSNYYYMKQQALLAEKIVSLSAADKVFFANSGAEANEGSIKLAKIYHYKKGNSQKYEIITLKNSFHGRTLATVAATGQEKFSAPYHPLTPGFLYVPANDLTAFEAAVSDKTCAVMLELIQGESGVHPLDLDYVKSVYEICKEKDILFICDEVQTGMGRTGKLFAYEHYGIEPDIFTLAKALGGGVPIGAVCAKDFAASAFAPGDHGSTFGGNPLACAAALSVFDIFEKENLVENSRIVGEYFMEQLKAIAENVPCIKEIRGKGLMIGIEFTGPIAGDMKHRLFEKHYLTGATATTLRILPPLIVTKKDVDQFMKILKEIL